MDDSDTVGDAVARAASDLGEIRYAVTAAGIMGEFSSVLEYPRMAWDRVISINLDGAFNAMQAELSHMVDGGSIVNIASGAGLHGAPLMSAYSASKHGIVGLTRTAAIEMGPRAIRVNAVCPGLIQSAMADELSDKSGGGMSLASSNPLGRIGRPEEIAQTAL